MPEFTDQIPLIGIWNTLLISFVFDDDQNNSFDSDDNDQRNI